MKLVLLALILAFTLAKEPLVKTVEQVRQHIETFDGTSIVMFFDPDAASDRKTKMIKEINNVILSSPEWQDAQFIQLGLVIDQIKAQTDRTVDPAKLVDELEFTAADLSGLKHEPTIAAFRNGWASWVHGENAVQIMKGKLKNFDVQAKERQADNK